MVTQLLKWIIGHHWNHGHLLRSDRGVIMRWGNTVTCPWSCHLSLAGHGVWMTIGVLARTPEFSGVETRKSLQASRCKGDDISLIHDNTRE